MASPLHHLQLILSLKSEGKRGGGSLADMRSFGGVSLLLLLVGLLVEEISSELRPRDPELEEQLEGLADAPLVEEKGNYPARSG